MFAFYLIRFPCMLFGLADATAGFDWLFLPVRKIRVQVLVPALLRSTSSRHRRSLLLLRSIQNRSSVRWQFLSAFVVLLCQTSRFSKSLFWVVVWEAIVSATTFFHKTKQPVNMKTQLALTVATLAVANAFSPSMNQAPATVSQPMMWPTTGDRCPNDESIEACRSPPSFWCPPYLISSLLRLEACTPLKFVFFLLLHDFVN